MPSPILNSDDLDAARGAYEGAGYLAFVSNAVVFQAHVSAVPTANVFGAISFDTVTTGAYTDVREGMVVLISTTLSNYTTSTDRYRVRKPPTSSLLYIDEASIALSIGDVVTVINAYDVRERVRRDVFFDFDLPYENLGPVITNMDSAYAALTTAGEAQFSFAPMGVPMADGATIASYAWDIPGAVYDVGDDETQNITVIIPETTEWGRLTVEDSNGVSTWFAFSLHIGDPDTDPRFLLCTDPITIEASVDTGYNATTSAFAGYDSIMDRTRCAVIVDERYGTSDLDVGHVRFVGYLTRDSSSTRGDAQHGVQQASQIDMEGFKAAAASLAFFPIAVRDVADPDAWDEMAKPTTERVISHILRHSTVPNLCAIDFGESFTETPDKWYAGNFDIADTSLMDAVRTVASEIKGELTSNAAGGFVFERHGSFLDSSERDALPDVLPEALNSGDAFEFTLDRQHKPRVGKVEMGARMFFSNGAPSVGYTAMAPAVAYGEGQERVTVPNALLPADDAADAALYASERAAYEFAWRNNMIVLNGELTDGFGWMSPSVAQWWPFDIAATDTTRGVVINANTRWMLMSVRTVINANGTQSVGAQWLPATDKGRALILVAKAPSAIESPLPVVPIAPEYPAFPPASSINYDTTEPDIAQPFDPFDGLGGSPLTPEDAADAAGNSAGVGCRVATTNFRYSSNVSFGFNTVLGEEYTVHVSGKAQIATDAWVYYGDFTTSDEGFAPQPGVEYGTWAPGGWQTTDALKPGAYRRSINIYRTFTSTNITHVSFVYDIEWGTYFNTLAVTIFVNNTTDIYLGYAYDFPDGNNLVASWSGSMTMDRILFLTNASVQATPDYDGYALQKSFIVRGTGTNPFTGEAGAPLYADAFYTWQEDEEGNVINVQFNSGGGLRLNNAAVSNPPVERNPNGEYTVTFIGTGNPMSFRFEDDDYSDNQSALMQMEICGPGAGQ